MLWMLGVRTEPVCMVHAWGHQHHNLSARGWCCDHLYFYYLHTASLNPGFRLKPPCSHLLCRSLQGPLSELFDSQQLLYDVSGAGNNWAHGHHGYGPQYHEALLGRMRAAAEAADSLQGFLLLHSLGGGTGSGLGTYLLGLLEVRKGAGRAWHASVSVGERAPSACTGWGARRACRKCW
jgi:hypothetical protein